MKFTFNPLTDNLDLVNTIEKVGSDPASGSEFDLIFNTTDNSMKIYYDSTWHILKTLTIPDRLLLESGFIIDLENGDELLAETAVESSSSEESYLVLES